MNGEKRLLPRAEVKFVDVGHYPEVSVKNMYEEFAKRPQVVLYMPPKINKGR